MNENSNKVFTTAISFTLLGILVMLIGIYYEISKINDAKKVDYTYKIYNEMTQWEKEHPKVEQWIYDISDSTSLIDNYKQWDFERYMDFFETLYSLRSKNLIDEELAYLLFSANIEFIYERNNGELRKLIQVIRKKYNDPEFYVGIESLYYDFMKERKTLEGEHKIIPPK